MGRDLRVLVADDAMFMRRSIIKLLKTDPQIEVVGQATNGREAFDRMNELAPDVVCLDVDMPEMDGITALKHIMSVRPTPTVIVSSLTDRQNIPFEALRLGAMDFFPKPSFQSGDLSEQARHLTYLVRCARLVNRANIRRVPITPNCSRSLADSPCQHLIAVGGTIGSVSGLIRLLSTLPAQNERGIAVIFRVPLHPSIASSFVDSLRNYFDWNVVRLDRSLVPRAGDAYLLPASKALHWNGDWLEVVDSDSVTPVDCLFGAVIDHYGKDGTLVLLAGDRPDGLEGLSQAADIGALTFVQDEETALFSSWTPELPIPVRRFDWGDIAQTLLQPTNYPVVGME